MTPDQALRVEAQKGSGFKESLVRNSAVIVDNNWILRFSKIVLVHGSNGSETRPFIKVLAPSDYEIIAQNEAGPRPLHTYFDDGIGTTWLRVEPWTTALDIGKYRVGLKTDFTSEGTTLDLDVRSKEPVIGHVVVSGIGTRHLKSALSSLLSNRV